MIFSPRDDGELKVDVENPTDLRGSSNESLAGAITAALSQGQGIMRVKLDDGYSYVAYSRMEKVGWAFLTILAEEEVLAPTNDLLAEINIRSQRMQEQIDDNCRRERKQQI